MTALRIIETVVILAACILAGRHYLHMMQLESYQTDGYIRWTRKNGAYRAWPVLFGCAGLAAALVLPVLFSPFFGTPTASRVTMRSLILICCAAASGYMILKDWCSKQKKPLVFTKRMKRLYFWLGAINLLLAAILYLLNVPAYLLLIAVPYMPVAAAMAAQPYENRVNGRFFKAAQDKLASRKDLVKIGITGSYGKTSTKFALEAILSEKFSVLASPASFNTPMGLSSIINNKLKLEHQVFIAEMGARHVGDISELMELVAPSISVITSVGPQHLETFGDIETVANTKFEIMAGLKKGGCGFFAADGAYVDKLYARAEGEKYRAGLEGDDLWMKADGITVGPRGSRFTLVCADGGSVECETKLLGLHNIQNITIACAVARKLGMTMNEIARGVRRVKPVEHRLQLIPGEVSVIDDAFNSNPVGASAALKVLGAFPGRHIIVTPGMVELGEKEKEFNREFGREMAGCCDIIILVGKKHSHPIYEGAAEAGFDKENIRVAADLDEARLILEPLTRPGDVVLFENDLPDNYTE